MSINLDKVKVGDTVYFRSYGNYFEQEVTKITKRTLETLDKTTGKTYVFTRSEYKSWFDLYGAKSEYQYLTNFDKEGIIKFEEKKKKEYELIKIKAEMKEFINTRGLSDFDTFKKIYEIITEVK